MTRQKKKAIRSLFKTIQKQQGQLEEKCLFKHLRISRYQFLKWCIRFNLLFIVHAEACLININRFDQSELLMSAENNCAFHRGLYYTFYFGIPHSLTDDPKKHLKSYNERFLDIPINLEQENYYWRRTK